MFLVKSCSKIFYQSVCAHVLMVKKDYKINCKVVVTKCNHNDLQKQLFMFSAFLFEIVIEKVCLNKHLSSKVKMCI